MLITSPSRQGGPSRPGGRSEQRGRCWVPETCSSATQGRGADLSPAQSRPQPHTPAARLAHLGSVNEDTLVKGLHFRISVSVPESPQPAPYQTRISPRTHLQGRPSGALPLSPEALCLGCRPAESGSYSICWSRTASRVQPPQGHLNVKGAEVELLCLVSSSTCCRREAAALGEASQRG